MPESLSTKPVQSELEDLPFYLVRMAVAFRRLNDSALREAGLKSQPLGAGSVLHMLFKRGSCTVKSLAEQVKIPNGTLTGVLNGLEQEGFIQRVKNQDDRRSWLIQLHLKGEALREKIERRHKIIMDLFESVLSPKETALLKDAFHRLTEAMDDHVESR